jgi:outer membrane protein
MIMSRAFFVLFCLFSLPLAAQEQFWTLEQCIQAAMKNNLALKQRSLSTQGAKAELKQNKIATLPSINASASNIWNVGFVINPITNTTERDATFRNNVFGLNANMNIFSGFQQSNSVRQQEANMKAAKYDEEATRNTIALQVSNAFMQVLMSDEIRQARAMQVEATRAQLDRQQKFYEVGGLNKAQLLQLKAQLANEEFQLVIAQTQLDQAYLSLWQSMNVDPNPQYQIEKPITQAESIDSELQTSTQIYQEFLKNSPEIKAAQQRARSAEISRYVALGSRSPRLSFTAGLNSFFTTQNMRGAGTPSFVPVPFFVDGNGQVISRLVPQFPNSEIVPFNDQFNQNLGRNYGFTLSVPIFNGWQVNTAIERSKIGLMSANLSKKQAEQDLYRDINQAWLDFATSRKRYDAARLSYEAGKEAFDVAEAQYQSSAIGVNDYLLSKNTLVQGETNLLQAKYELFFRRKVLDFYLGKSLY